jgi:U3 small nucleolar RNA-associated protein 7
VGKVRAVPKEVQQERRETAVSAQLAATKGERDVNADKSRMKGKNRVSKRYRKKQQNVVDDKKLRAKAGPATTLTPRCRHRQPQP